MASLPTAYASQRFGRKTLDFYAAGGEVIGGDPRARADERRLEDLEGARHTVRLMESGFTLEPGDQATVLRMQPGPARRSRPVAVINHTRGEWTRTHPGASTLLARVGVGRALNFSLTLALFALAALVVVWPFVRAFLVEIDPALFSAAPAFDVFALAAGVLPAIAELRLSEILAPVGASLGQALPMLSGLEAPIGYTIAALAGAVFVFWSRSWRLLWAPLYVVSLGAGALMFTGVEGAVTPMLAGLGLATTLFLVGGLINSIRDTVRFERRIAVLADHIRNNADEELTPTSAPAEQAEDALAPIAPVGVAASLREPEDGDVETHSAVEVEVEAEAESGADPVSEEIEASEVDSDSEAPEAVDAVVDPEALEAQSDLAETSDVESADAEVVEPEVVEGEVETEPQPQPEPVAEVNEAEEITEASSEAPAEEITEEEPVLTPADVLNPQTQEESPAEVSPEPELDAEAADAVAPVEAEAEPAEADVPESEMSQTETSEEGASEAELSEAEPADADLSEAAAPEASGDAEAPTRFEDEESERLKTDPRYAARAIVLPPPPPMPGEAGEPSASEEAEAAAPRSQTRTLRPTAALPPNVVPIFGAPPSAPQSEDDKSE